ncbi:MAG: hypothetical protein R3C11_24415 [Planctomycetaceae bacterium]
MELHLEGHTLVVLTIHLNQSPMPSPLEQILSWYMVEVCSQKWSLSMQDRKYTGRWKYLVQNGSMSSFILPRATGSQELPTILNSAGNAFLLASDAEVSGFVIENAGGYGIYASGTTNGYLSNIEILNSGGGIRLDGVDGEFILDDITIDESTGTCSLNSE